MSGYERYFYPGTATLQNKLGIKDREDLATAEAELTRARMREPVGKLDPTPEGLGRIHHHIFRDVYPWAGQFRTLDMALAQAGRTKDVQFAPGYLVARVEVPRFCDQLRADLDSPRGFQAPGRQDFAYRAAVYLKDLNYIHPFPEGNGRVQRVFLDQLAQHSGFRLDQSALTPEAWLAASRESYRQPESGPHAQMTALIAGAIQDRDQAREENGRQQRAGQHRAAPNREPTRGGKGRDR